MKRLGKYLTCAIVVRPDPHICELEQLTQDEGKEIFKC